MLRSIAALVVVGGLSLAALASSVSPKRSPVQAAVLVAFGGVSAVYFGMLMESAIVVGEDKRQKKLQEIREKKSLPSPQNKLSQLEFILTLDVDPKDIPQKEDLS